MSTEFRKDFNLWALAFFGTKPEVPNTPFVLHDHVFVTTHQYEELRRELHRYPPVLV